MDDAAIPDAVIKADIKRYGRFLETYRSGRARTGTLVSGGTLRTLKRQRET